jgi:hypothetical protein
MRQSALLLLCLVACNENPAPTPAPAAPASTLAIASVSAPSIAPRAPSTGLGASEFARLFKELSEPDQYFFSNNYVSNETSYLQVAEALERRAQPGAAYIGVGPEQNFTYIAILKPKLSFIVDIRRGNAVQQLLYKAIFHEASSRSHFIHLLLGKPFDKHGDPGAKGGIDEVLKHVATSKADAKVYRESHARFLGRIEKEFGVPLSDKDEQTLSETHKAFFDKQLDLRFELHGKNFRDYPSLAELLSAKDPGGRQRGFLATEDAFRTVQLLQRQHRIIPVVGDFAGPHALKAVAAELRRSDVPVAAFYVSNVEQYVMEPDKWKAYVSNIDALPTNEKSLFIRCYLDQGKKHPQQLAGHRTASVLQTFDHFRWKQRSKGYGSFWQLATDGVLDSDSGAP